MARKSAIEWLEGGASWNFLYGCTKVAQGCTHCYAERVIPRLGVRGTGPVLPEQKRSGPASYRGQVILREDHLEDPLHWTKPVKIFVNSLSDTFHPSVPDDLLDRAFSVMARAKQHTFIVLTKRPKRMRSYFDGCARGADEVGGLFPWPNVWAGASASTQAELDDALEHLAHTKAALRFLSLEPLVEEVDLRLRLSPIRWVIVGGESGRLARPCREEWVKKVVDQCRQAGVPVFVKQMGAWWAKEVKLASGPNALDTKGNEPAVWPEGIRVREVPRGSPSAPSPTPVKPGWKPSEFPCRSCGAAGTVTYRIVTSSDGAHDDEQWQCSACGKSGWVDGIDS